jgi:hypothetical protein
MSIIVVLPQVIEVHRVPFRGIGRIMQKFGDLLGIPLSIQTFMSLIVEDVP